MPTTPEPSSADLFTPKIVTVWREGYGLKELRADAIAGLTVAIVALPLSLAIAIASGASPERGLFTAIVGGFLISALGGSRFQIGGPAGAFIVLVASIIERQGIDGFLLATFLAGIMLMIGGALRLGTYIKFIPFPVTVGFTAGIAVIIMASQLKDLFGLTLDGAEPGPFLPKLQALGSAVATANPAAITIALIVVAIIVLCRKISPRLPGMLIAVAAAAVATWALELPVETIATRFGGIPNTLPVPALPDLSLARIAAVLPDAFSIALLGAIESLLSAVVADGMTGRRHRSNCELIAQGVANMGAAIFGGLSATGTIARTATNVRAGAIGPVAGMLHAVFLLAFMMFAASLAGYIPLAALAAVLVTVAWNMAEKHEFAVLLRASRGDAVVLLASFLLTIFYDLTAGILVGFGIGVLLFLSRMAQAIEIQTHSPLFPPDLPDDADARERYDASLASDPDIIVYRISGAFFFGAASKVIAVLDRVADAGKTLVLDLSSVPFLDSTGASTIDGFARKAEKAGIKLMITGAAPALRRVLKIHHVRPPRVQFKPTIEDALAAARGQHHRHDTFDDDSG
jgi:SulP family sulfate permease